MSHDAPMPHATYRIHSWINVRQHPSGDTQVVDTLTGAKFSVSGKIGALLVGLRNPATVPELQARTAGLSEQQVQTALNSLLAKRLIYDISHRESLPVTIPAATPLFQVPTAVPKGQQHIAFLGIPASIGNRGDPGTSGAPDALRDYAKKHNFTLAPAQGGDGTCIFEGLTIEHPIDLRAVVSATASNRVIDGGNVAVFGNTPHQVVHTRILEAVDSLVQNKAVPILIGGDHAVTYPVLRAISRHHEQLDILHIDAHTDTYDGGASAFPEFAEQYNHGNFMSWVLREITNISRVHQFGIRGLCNLVQTTDSKRQVHWIHETRRFALGKQDMDIPTDRPVYLTIDIDALNPACVPGTASPVPGGLELFELLLLLRRLLVGRNIVGVDIVEIDPSRDRDGITVACALEILFFIVSELALQLPVGPPPGVAAGDH